MSACYALIAFLAGPVGAETVRVDLNQARPRPTAAVLADVAHESGKRAMLGDGRVLQASEDARALEIRALDGTVHSIPLLQEMNYLVQTSANFAYLELRTDDYTNRVFVLVQTGGGQRWAINGGDRGPDATIKDDVAVIRVGGTVSIFPSDLKQKFEFPIGPDAQAPNVDELDGGYLVYGRGMSGVVVGRRGQPPKLINAADLAKMTSCNGESDGASPAPLVTCQDKDEHGYVLLPDLGQLWRSGEERWMWRSGSFVLSCLGCDRTKSTGTKVLFRNLNTLSTPAVEVVVPFRRPILGFSAERGRFGVLTDDLQIFMIEERQIVAALKAGRARDALKGLRALGRAASEVGAHELWTRALAKKEWQVVNAPGGLEIFRPASPRYSIPSLGTDDLNVNILGDEFAFLRLNDPTNTASQLLDLKTGLLVALDEGFNSARISPDARTIWLQGSDRDQILSVTGLRERAPSILVAKNAVTLAPSAIERCEVGVSAPPRLARILRWRSGVGEGSTRALTETLADDLDPVELEALAQALQRFALVDERRLAPLASRPSIVRKLEAAAATSRPNPCFGDYEKQVADDWMRQRAGKTQALGQDERLSWLVLAPFARVHPERAQFAAGLTKRLRESTRFFRFTTPIPERSLEGLLQAMVAPLVGEPKPAFSMISPVVGGGFTLLSAYPTTGLNTSLNAFGFYQGPIALDWLPRREGQAGSKDLVWRSAGYEFKSRINAVRQADAARVYPASVAPPSSWKKAKTFSTLVMAATTYSGSMDTLETQLKADGWKTEVTRVSNAGDYLRQKLKEVDCAVEYSATDREVDTAFSYARDSEVLVAERTTADQRNERLYYVRPVSSASVQFEKYSTEALRATLDERSGRPLALVLNGSRTRVRDARAIMAAVWSPSLFVIPTQSGSSEPSLQADSVVRVLIDNFERATPWSRLRERLATVTDGSYYLLPNEKNYRAFVIEQLGVRAKSQVLSHHRRIEAAP